MPPFQNPEAKGNQRLLEVMAGSQRRAGKIQLIEFTGVPAECERVVFPVSIYDADNRHQSFGQVRNAFIRIVNRTDGNELARFDLTEDASTETAMVFGELYRHNGEWKFRAVGQGYASGLAGIAMDFGVNVG